MSERYRRSEELLARAEQTIPLGTQTFSKSKTQFPYGVSPFYATRAKGSRLWDADGNEYIDFINSLCSVTLGYNDPDVTAAVRAQLDEGVIFSLPSELEIQVAELLVDLVPCAERVRFGKNGSDATAGAVRVARAFTGRDRVAVCGYHGWQDWYIGTTSRNAGVPASLSSINAPSGPNTSARTPNSWATLANCSPARGVRRRTPSATPSRRTVWRYRYGLRSRNSSKTIATTPSAVAIRNA